MPNFGEAVEKNRQKSSGHRLASAEEAAIRLAAAGLSEGMAKLPSRQTGRHLAYVVAFDPPGSPGHRMMGKMLASSLLRTYFDGDIIVFRNSPEPLFRVQRVGLEEFYIPTPEVRGLEGAEYSWCWKYKVREVIDASRHDKVLFLDADCLVLRNIDHLLEGPWDIAFQPELALNIDSPQFSCFLTDGEKATLKRPGVNSGTLAVRGAIFQEAMAEWERIDMSEPPQPRGCSDQGSWNRLLLDHTTAGLNPREAKWRAVRFERGEVQFPIYLDPKWSDYKHAAIVHCLGGDTRDKLRFMFGLYMGTFFFDDSSTLVNLLEM